MGGNNRRDDGWLRDLLSQQLGSDLGGPSATSRPDGLLFDDWEEIAVEADVPPSLTEPRIDDVDALRASVVTAETLTTLVAEVLPVRRDLDARLLMPLLEGSEPRAEFLPTGELAAGSTMELAVADDRAVDQALWSMLRENWRRGTPLFGATVH